MGGRRFRILAVVDDFTRECLALIADTSLPGLRVVRELDIIVAQRGRPAMCVSDNGTELTGMAVLRWSQESRIEWHYIAPGKPTQNAFIESLHHGLRAPPRCSSEPGGLKCNWDSAHRWMNRGAQTSTKAGWRCCSGISFGPYSLRRCSASAVVNPRRVSGVEVRC